MYIKHLQLSKFPCPRKSPNGEFGGFLRISALRNADFSNSPFCPNRDKSLQFNLKHRHKKSRLWCPNGIRAKKMVEDYFHRKTVNAKSAVLKFAIKLAGVLRFIKRFSGSPNSTPIFVEFPGE